jgi:hypothetical protein
MKTTVNIKFKTFRFLRPAKNPKTGKPQSTEIEITAGDAFSALGKFLKRGVNGLGKGWTLTRQSDGWIVAVNTNHRTLERIYHRFKEVDWDRKQTSV